MKIKTLAITALLAAGFALTSQTALATLSYSYGDIFIGFRKTGASEDYLVNIGNVSQFSKLDGSSFTVDLGGSIAADLVTAFGSNWATTSTLFWGAAGTTFDGAPTSLETLYFTKARTGTVTGITKQTTAPTTFPSSTQGGIATDLDALRIKYTTDGNATENSTKGTFQTAAQDNTWNYFTNSGGDFGSYGGNVDGASFQSNGTTRLGTATSVLDFYKLDPSLDSTAATYLGKFTINDNAVITFTSVPEPSTYGLVIGAGALLLIWRRKRASV